MLLARLCGLRGNGMRTYVFVLSEAKLLLYLRATWSSEVRCTAALRLLDYKGNSFVVGRFFR